MRKFFARAVEPGEWMIFLRPIVIDVGCRSSFRGNRTDLILKSFIENHRYVCSRFL
jgi:hypothetical protein